MPIAATSCAAWCSWSRACVSDCASAGSTFIHRAFPLLNTTIPFVAAVAPVAAVPLGHEHDPRQILRVLVPELRRRMDPRRRAPGRIQVVAVLGVHHERLRMHRAVDVPALVIVVVE